MHFRMFAFWPSIAEWLAGYRGPSRIVTNGPNPALMTLKRHSAMSVTCSIVIHPHRSPFALRLAILDFCKCQSRQSSCCCRVTLSQTYITSARLTMRAFTAADAAVSFAEANDHVAKFMSWNPPASDTEFRTIWRRGISDMKTGKGSHLVIRLTSTNEFIGRAGLHPADATLLQTGLWIKESAQGRIWARGCCCCD
jgi:hypothetical protein